MKRSGNDGAEKTEHDLRDHFQRSHGEENVRPEGLYEVTASAVHGHYPEAETAAMGVNLA